MPAKHLHELIRVGAGIATVSAGTFQFRNVPRYPSLGTVLVGNEEATVQTPFFHDACGRPGFSIMLAGA